MHGLFIAVTSLVEHYLSVHGLSSHGMQALGAGLVVVAHGFSCFRGIWNLPGPGIKPTSPALTGGLLSILPSGKSLSFLLYEVNSSCPVQLFVRDHNNKHVETRIILTL